MDVFADVPGLPTYLGTVTAADGTALVDLVLDRNPFMLANGPRRAARPHALMVPRSHRDGWSSATPAELAACHTAMTLVAAWYRSLDGGHVVFCANDSPPNLDYLRDTEAAAGPPPTAAPRRRSPGIPGRRCSTPTCTPSTPKTARPRTTSRRRWPGIPSSPRAPGVQRRPRQRRRAGRRGSARLAAGVRAAAQPWGGSYCSYQLGVDGPLWVMPALGPSQDDVNRRLARADGLQAEPDPKLGGAINLVRPSLADAGRSAAAQRATADQRASFGPSWPSAD